MPPSPNVRWEAREDQQTKKLFTQFPTAQPTYTLANSNLIAIPQRYSP